MKRLVTAAACAAFSFTLFFKCSEIIKPVKASAAEVSLTPEETLALFGDSIRGVGYLGSNVNPSIVYFDYISDGWVSGVSNGNAFGYSPLDNDCIVYKSRSPYQFNNSLSSSNMQSLTLYPDISLSNLTDLSFTIGLTFDGVTLYNPNSTSYSYTQIKYLTNFWTQLDDDYRYMNLAYTSRNGIKTVASEDIKVNECDWSLDRSFNVDILPYVYNLHSNIPFTFSIDSDLDCSLMNHNMIGKNSATNIDHPNPDVNTYTFLVIECPTLNSDYVNNNSGGGSGGDSGGGSGDCNCSHIDYTSKLDTLINQGITFNQQLNDIYMENQHQNSKLDSANSYLGAGNSKLDTVNSNLNKINSYIVSQSARDSSHIADNTSRMAAEISDAMQDHQYIDSIARSAEMSLPNLDNQHALDSSFDDVWYYTDEDGLKWSNPLLFAMPIVTLTIGVLSYIIFGKKG